MFETVSFHISMKRVFNHIASFLFLWFIYSCDSIPRQENITDNNVTLSLSYTDSLGKVHPAKIEFSVSQEEFIYLQEGANYNTSMLITESPSVDTIHGALDDHIGANSEAAILPSYVQNGQSFKYNLGPEGIVLTEIKGEEKNMAYVTFYAGSMELYTVTLTQVQPTATLSSDLILGGFTIKKGAKLKMQIPTELQDGYVFLACQFKSGDGDETNFGSIVSTWNL